MSALTETLIRAHGDAVHAARLAEHNGNTGVAAWFREDAARLAEQARKAAGK